MTRVHVQRRAANSSLRGTETTHFFVKRMLGMNGREQSLEEFAGKAKPKRKKSKGPRACARQHELARAAAEELIRSKEWQRADGQAIVGLYSLLHTRVYGVLPDELDGPDYLAAVQAAKRMCEQLTPRGAYELLHWTWRAEEAKAQRAIYDGQERARIGWRLQFHASKVTDFKVSRARSGQRVR